MELCDFIPVEQIPPNPSRNRVNRERLLALLQEDCLSHSEIARRVGVTRERVRQLANRLIQQTGTERHQVCVFNRREVELNCDPFIIAARMRGLEPTPYGAKGQFIINNKLCFVRRSDLKKGYTHINCPQMEADVCAWSLPNGSYLIIPRSKWPTTSTMFSLKPLSKAGAYCRRHDWPSFVDAWQIFTEEQ